MLKVLVLCLGAASAFVAPASMQQQSRTSAVSMMARNPFQSSGGKPKPEKNARPLSPGSNYPTTKNIQTQRNGIGNPAYLAAERKDMAEKSKRNTMAIENKRKR